MGVVVANTSPAAESFRARPAKPAPGWSTRQGLRGTPCLFPRISSTPPRESPVRTGPEHTGVLLKDYALSYRMLQKVGSASRPPDILKGTAPVREDPARGP